MRLLIDTHVLLWALRDPARLSPRAAALISEMGNELVVSSASAWEISTKYRLGKLPAGESLVLAWQSNLQRLGAVELAISHGHAVAAGGLDWEHRDPFDRMLAAQAILEQLPLVTSDDAFAGLAGIRVLW